MENRNHIWLLVSLAVAGIVSAWAFFRVRRAACAVLLAPLLWVTFHLYLGFGIAFHHSETMNDVLQRLL